MKRDEWKSLLLRVSCCLLLMLLPACHKEESALKIGFVGGLTGRVAGLGVAGRDAVQLAVEEFNRSGGLRGRMIEIVSRDDQQRPEIAEKAVGELIDNRVVAIIGPMTSSMAIACQPVVNREQVVMISPTVTTNQLNDQEDFFLRMSLPLKVNAGKLAGYALAHNIRSVAVSLETGNRAYTEDWLASFREPFEAQGGRVLLVERFKSGADGGFLAQAQRLLGAGPDALLLLSGAMDTAMVSQQVRKLGSHIPLFASEWSFTSDVINFGGGAAEGMRSYVTYNPDSRTPQHEVFSRDFERRFGYRPSFAAVLAYESVRYLLLGLERNPRRERLKETLLSVGSFEGLQGTVRINRYGDAERETFLAEIRDGRFRAIE